jgi:hypothetical protein
MYITMWQMIKLKFAALTESKSKTSRRYKKRHSLPATMYPPLMDYSLHRMDRSQTWCYHGLYRPGCGPLYSKSDPFSVPPRSGESAIWMIFCVRSDTSCPMVYSLCLYPADLKLIPPTYSTKVVYLHCNDVQVTNM